jgi:hypothetical protein
VCLTQGRFLDGTAPADLPRPVEVVPTEGRALRTALGLPGPAVDTVDSADTVAAAPARPGSLPLVAVAPGRTETRS